MPGSAGTNVLPTNARRRLRLALTIAAAAAALILLVGLSVPVLLIPWAESEVQRRIERKLDTSVEIERVQLRWGRAQLSGVSFGGRDGEPSFEFDNIHIELVHRALWRGRVEVQNVTVTGGAIEGSVQEFQEFVARVRGGSRRPGSGSGRVKLRPKRIHIADLRVRATHQLGDAPIEVRGTYSADIEVEAARVAWSVFDVELTGSPLSLRATSVSSTVQARRSDTGYALEFPLRAQIRGASAPLTDALAIAGVDGWIQVSDAEASELSMELAGAFGDGDEDPDDKLWTVAGHVARNLSEGVVRVDMDAFELARVPARVLEKLPLVESEDAVVGGHLAVVFGSGVAALEGELSVEGAGLQWATLSRTPVRDLSFDVSFAAEVDPKMRRATLHYVDVARQGVLLRTTARIEHPARTRGRRYDVEFTVPKVRCQDVLTAVPRGFAPGLRDFRLDGEFQAQVRAHVDYADLEQLSLEGKVDMGGCEVLQTPQVADAYRLARGFTHEVRMKNGRTTSVQMYPEAPGFASLDEISPYVMAAVRTTEDGGFWRHNGFLPSQFEVALRRNLAAGRVRLGASTITMQMVKNILLGHERTLSRKFQEMFLTWYVEQVLSKERIMELYLNGIEFGPGIYGIVDAANYYFGKPPADLSPPEAVYLALMLPSPVKRSANYCGGALTPRFATKLQRMLEIMNERERLSDFDFLIWKDMEVTFDLQRRTSERGCYERIEDMQAGTNTQMPVHGLLPIPALN